MAPKRGFSDENPRDDSFSSPLPPRKRKREYTEADAALAETLERLGSEIEKHRIKAAVEIVNSFKTTKSLSGKILVRLIRGLCSSRKASRPGFFIALTEVVKVARDEPAILDKQRPADALALVLDKIRSETKVDGGSSSQEKRDYLLGRLTGYSAVVHSAVLFEDGLEDLYLNSVLQEVYDISQHTPQLAEQCGKIYFDLVQLAVIKTRKEPIESTLRFLGEKILLKSPEGVALWLEAFDSGIDIRFPKHIWHHKDPLSAKDLPTLAKVLKGDSAQDKSEELTKPGKNSSGSRRDTPHFAWTIILNSLSERVQEPAKLDVGDSSYSIFRRFWTEAVDDVYFASNASAERKALGLRIFSIVVSNGPIWACVQALSPKLMNCIINQRSKDERLLHNAATSILDNLKSRAAFEETLAEALLSNMAMKDGKADYERLGKNKSFLNQLFDATADAVAESMVASYSRILYRPGTKDQQDTEKIRRTIADFLVSSIRLRKHQESSQDDSPPVWRSSILNTLIRCTCLQSEYDSESELSCQPPLSESSREMLKSRLLSCLKELLNTQDSFDVDIVLSAASGLGDHDMQDLVAATKLDDAAKGITLGTKALNDLQKMATEKSPSDAPYLRAFQLLFSMAVIQICCGESDAVPILIELQANFDKIKERRKSQPGGLDNIIEILLGFCSKPSALYRSLAEQAFAAFAPELSAESLVSLVHVLDQEENLGGQRELFDQQNEEEDNQVNGTADEDGQSISDADSLDSDVEVVDAVEDAGSSSDAESSDDGVTSSSEDDDQVNDADEALNDSLAKILQTRNINSAAIPNGHADNVDADSSSDESMDDEQMEALGIDNQLSAIFAQRQNQSKSGNKISDKKREQKDAKQNILNFKNRVLDLLAIYVKQQHASPIALGLIQPLVQLVGRTRSAQVAKKASDLLESYFKGAKTKGMPLLATTEQIWGTLNQLHEEVLVFPSKLHASASSRSSLFLARLLMLKKEEGAMSRLIRLYAATHEERFTTTSKVPASFWTDFVNWSVDMGNEK